MNTPVDDGPSGWVWVVVVVVAASLSIGKAYGRFIAQWWQGILGKNWPTIPATIDNVSVAEQIEQTRYGTVTTYLATLTYFYRNPELQIGDYSREFNASEKAYAYDWSNSYKGKTVMVHVDPRDPTRSVLTKEEVLRNEPPY